MVATTYKTNYDLGNTIKVVVRTLRVNNAEWPPPDTGSILYCDHRQRREPYSTVTTTGDEVRTVHRKGTRSKRHEPNSTVNTIYVTLFTLKAPPPHGTRPIVCDDHQEEIRAPAAPCTPYSYQTYDYFHKLLSNFAIKYNLSKKL